MSCMRRTDLFLPRNWKCRSCGLQRGESEGLPSKGIERREDCGMRMRDEEAVYSVSLGSESSETLRCRGSTCGGTGTKSLGLEVYCCGWSCNRHSIAERVNSNRLCK